MNNITVWNTVKRDSWTCTRQPAVSSCIVYRLTSLPNFTHQRFGYLCEEKDQRSSAVGSRQLLMLRQLHSLGTAWACSMRLLKTADRLEQYFVFRHAGSRALTEQELEQADASIRNALPRNEYSFQRVAEADCPPEVFSAEWAGQAAEIFKKEEVYHGAAYPAQFHAEPQEFYVPYAWTAAENTMEQICQALMQHNGPAVLEVTLCPTTYLEDEKNWMNGNLRRLRESMNGETIRSESTGRILWQGEKLPVLKTPVDNCEKMNKQFETSRVFLTAIRVFSGSDVSALANAFLTNSVRNAGYVCTSQRGQAAFEQEAARYAGVDISAGVRTPFWNRPDDLLPLRAQRLFHLASVEEIATFFRIPIPVRDNFPGFRLDTGLGEVKNKKKARSVIRLGSYLDDQSAEPTPAEFDSQQMAKHGLIVGVPGSGKTTAMFNILYQLWDVPEEQKIPFIVLEPAKTEYRALKLLPALKDDLLVFTLGDESVSPFRFNPMEVLPGIKIENHISRLQACFVGAFNLFDPLPIFLEQAIRRTYLEKGWYDDSVGGDEGLETPTLSDLCRNAEYIVENSGFDAKMKSDFKASLLERLNSLRRGSKGRMLDTPHSIPMEELMGRPVILELDSLNGDEKSLLMMFLLSYVYEYCKIARKSGSPLKHMLLVEEAHNLIGANKSSSDSRADPGEKTIELFVNMLAEMRALGQGILIADQLPTAIAPQAVKQTNVKVLMRVTAKDDREEIGNTMDLNEEQMHQVVNFKTGHAYLYHEGEDHVRMIRMRNFKDDYHVEEPPSDPELRELMHGYELSHPRLYHPYAECLGHCPTCNRRVRNQAESYVQRILTDPAALPMLDPVLRQSVSFCGLCALGTMQEAARIRDRYKTVSDCFGYCVYVHLLHLADRKMAECKKRNKKCGCTVEDHQRYLNLFEEKGKS